MRGIGWRVGPVLAALLLAACASPEPRFFGADRVTVERDGMRYALFTLGRETQVIRLSRTRRGTHEAQIATMIALAEAETGCRVVPGSARGDSGVLTVRLDC